MSDAPTTSNAGYLTKLLSAATPLTLAATILVGDCQMLLSTYFETPPAAHRYDWEADARQYITSDIPDYLFEHDIYVNMPPKKQYTVNARIQRVMRGELTVIVVPEA